MTLPHSYSSAPCSPLMTQVLTRSPFSTSALGGDQRVEASWVVTQLPFHNNCIVLERRVSCIQLSCWDTSPSIDTLSTDIATLIQDSNTVTVFELHTHAPIIPLLLCLYHAVVELPSQVDTQTMYHRSVTP